MKNALIKIYNLRKSLDDWEKRAGIQHLNTNCRIILAALHKSKNSFPVNKIKSTYLIKSSMSNATFNRSIKLLLKAKKIKLSASSSDKRSQMIKIV